METTYNGWTNRETWLVNLWLTNDEGTYYDIRGMNAIQLESYVDHLIDADMPASFSLDLINAALAHVNWDEIAESVKEDAA